MNSENRPPVSMKEGLIAIQEAAIQKLKRHGETVLVIEGRKGSGKSTLIGVLEDTQIGGIVRPEQLWVNDEFRYNAPAANQANNYERDLIAGNFPQLFKGKLAIGGAVGALWLRERFKDDERFTWILLQSGPFTRLLNSSLRVYPIYRDAGYSRVEILREFLPQVARDLIHDPEIQMSVPNYVPNIIIDTSLKNRIAVSEAKLILNNRTAR